MQTISHKQAEDLMRATAGRLFRVNFIKRGNDAPRRLIGRLGVQKGVNGEGMKFNPRDLNLLVVHEFVGAGQGAGGRHSNLGTQFRMVPLERVEALRVGGQEYEVR